MLVREVHAMSKKSRANKSNFPGWRTYTLPNLITRHREARKAEQNRRRLAEQLKASPISQAMGAVFGVGLTDENSSDQN